MSTKFFRIVSLIKLKDRVWIRNRARVLGQGTGRTASVHQLFPQIAPAMGAIRSRAQLFGKRWLHNPARTTNANWDARSTRLNICQGSDCLPLFASFATFLCVLAVEGLTLTRIISKLELQRTPRNAAKFAKEGSTVKPGCRPGSAEGQCDSLLVQALKTFLTRMTRFRSEIIKATK